jgi:hypothetical protein
MSTAPNPQPSGMFSEPAKSGFPTTAVAIASVAIVILVGFLILMSHRHPEAESMDYAPNIAFSHIQMSESTSLSGGKSTYIDGHVTNNGKLTVTGVSLHVIFKNDEAMPPQIEITPLSLIRTREPYVDTQPISAAPLAPGAEREFRLIFENINSNWNQQEPEIHITGVRTR